MSLRNKKLISYGWTIAILIVILWMVSSPKLAFDAALQGLSVWWNIVFPALLPFFIGSELLFGLGFVNLLGGLLEPLMRPIFNLPGSGAFVLAMSYTSGFPIGSQLTTQIYEDGQINRGEADRLLAFSNNASPLFMLGAVAVGMYNNPELGILIAICHYLANICLGLLTSILSTRNNGLVVRPSMTNISRAFSIYNKQIHRNYQPMGQRLAQAITKSINVLLLIGGFIILFSVLLAMTKSLGLLTVLNSFFGLLLALIGFDQNLASGLATGLFEVTLGVKNVAESSSPLKEQLAITTFLLGWAGLSVHAQVISIISKTGLSYKRFFLGRLFQASLGGFLVWLLYDTFEQYIFDSAPTFSQGIHTTSWITQLSSHLVFFIGSIIALTALSIITYIVSNLVRLLFRR